MIKVKNKDEVGCMLWGHKSGYKLLAENNIIFDKSIASKINFMEGEFTDVRYSFDCNKQETNFFDFRLMADSKCYTVYETIYDGKKRPGFYAISVFLDNKRELTGEGIYKMLESLLVNFRNRYLVKNDLGFYKINPDKAIKISELFIGIVRGPLAQVRKTVIKKSNEEEIYDLTNTKDVSYVFDYLAEFGSSKTVYITPAKISLKPTTQDTTPLIKQIKNKKATRSIHFLLVNKHDPSNLVNGVMDIQYENNRQTIKIEQNSIFPVVIYDELSPIKYQISELVGYETPVTGFTTYQEIRNNGNQLTIELTEKPHFILKVNKRGKNLSADDFILKVNDQPRTIPDANMIKLYLNNIGEQVKIEIIPHEANLKTWIDTLTISERKEVKEISIAAKPILSIEVLDGKGKPIIDKGEYTISINGVPTTEEKINLENYSQKIEFELISDIYGKVVESFEPETLQNESRIQLKFKGVKNIQEYKWTVKDSATGKYITEVNYSITLKDKSVINGVSDSSGVISGVLRNKDNSPVKKTEVVVTLNKPGFEFRKDSFNSFTGTLTMGEQKKTMTISIKNDAEILSQIKHITYQSPPQLGVSAPIKIENKSIKIQFPYSYSAKKGDKLIIKPQLNRKSEVELNEVVIKLFKKEKDLFYNIPFSIEFKEKARVPRGAWLGLGLFALIFLTGMGFYGMQGKWFWEGGEDTMIADKATKPASDKTAKVKADKAAQPTSNKATKVKTDEAVQPTSDKATKVKVDEVAKPASDKAVKVKTDKAAKPTSDKSAKVRADEVAEDQNLSKETLEKLVLDEIEESDFKSNLETTTQLWKKQLKEIYGFEFSEPEHTKIIAYESTAKAIWWVKENRSEREFTDNLTKIVFYQGCEYKEFYTREQIDFLLNFIGMKTRKGVELYGDTYEVPDKCNPK